MLCQVQMLHTPSTLQENLQTLKQLSNPRVKKDFTHNSEPPSLSLDTEPSEDENKPKPLEPMEVSATELIAQEEIEIFQNSHSTTSVQVSGETVKVFPSIETVVTAASERKLEGATLRPHLYFCFCDA